MFEIFKNLFGGKKEKEYVPDPPGRTFNRVITGRYFGCEDVNADESSVAEAKQKKIDQITELGLLPMFTRYSYEDTRKNKRETQVKEDHPDIEVSAEKQNMVHVTEISFTVKRSDFDEFEQMSGVSLSDNFKDLSSDENSATNNRKERRKVKRET